MARAAAELHDTLAILATFGETCIYSPKNGEAREITAEVQESSERMDEADGVYLVTTLMVLVRRDELAGISKPIFGDTICREDDIDDDGTPDPLRVCSFTGIVESKDSACHRLRFERRAPYELGGTRRR